MRSPHQQKHKLPESAWVVASSTSYFAEEASKHGLTRKDMCCWQS